MYWFVYNEDLIVVATPSSMHSLFELRPVLPGDSFFLATTDSIFREVEFKQFLAYCKGHPKYDGVLAEAA